MRENVIRATSETDVTTSSPENDVTLVRVVSESPSARLVGPGPEWKGQGPKWRMKGVGSKFGLSLRNTVLPLIQLLRQLGESRVVGDGARVTGTNGPLNVP